MKSFWFRLLYLARDFRSRKLFEVLRRHSQGEVLDIGGWDFFLTARAKGVPFERWTCLEAGPDRLLEPRDARFSLVHGDGCAMDFPDASFDTVLCVQVLEHVLEPLRMMDEIERLSLIHISEPTRPY